MKNFWEKLNSPFFCLAPMADVTDRAFREIIAKYGKPDVFWTEFTSADGLAHTKGRKKLLINLKFSRKERPIVAQIFGSNPENIKKASALCQKLGFAGVDINMGCPDKAIEKQKSGAAMIKDIDLAKKIIDMAREGAHKIPVSVKTRIGYGGSSLNEEWIKGLLEKKLPALTIHLRTRREMSKVPAHWEFMDRIIKLRDEISPETLIIGNGDVLDLEDAKQKAKKYKCDGVMLGRAIFGNPWLYVHSGNNSKFSQVLGFPRQKFTPSGLEARPDRSKTLIVSTTEKLKVMLEHTKLFEKYLREYKSFAVMKKHYKAYVNGFDGAKELRMQLMQTKNTKEVEKIVKNFIKSL